MSRYNNYGLPPHGASSNKSSSSFNSGLNSERHDDHGSQSGSEDGNYAIYPDAHKIEAELEDDSNTALTSQTLNADGTPKRPMNAFMIFARRRRPQVSAENQAMRTGEISKILSKEWVAMSPSDKQFYLEQAKQLKETFNSRYPDYVYRRRPNNSRKRRRSDSGSTRLTDPNLPDNQDDGGSVDLEVSPTDADNHLEPSLPPSYSRPPYTMPQTSLDHGKYNGHSRSAGHQVSSDSSFRMGGHHDSRPSYGGPTHSERMGTGVSPRMSISHEGMHYGYGQPPTNPQSPSIFGTESISPQQPWQPRWLGGSPQDRVSSSMGGPKQNPYSTTASSPWSSSNEHPSGPSNQSPTSPNFFPTLNTPFYPSQPPVPSFQSNISTSPSLGSQSSSYEPLGHMSSSGMSRDYTPRGYPSSSSITPGSSYPTSVSGRDTLSYPQRSLPPVQTSSGYSNSQPSSSSSSSGHGHAPPPFWSR